MKTYLKIKIKSLAAESRIIRQEEKKWRGGHPMRISLWEHRIKIVRAEARASLLAYGFLRGRKIWTIETSGKLPPAIWARARQIAVRFSSEKEAVTRMRFEDWTAEQPAVTQAA